MVLHKSNKYLIDTNILIYSVYESNLFFKKAREFLSSIYDSQYETYISTQNILEFKRVMTYISKNTDDEFALVDNAVSKFVDGIKLIYEDELVWIEYKKLDLKYRPKGNRIFDLWLVASMVSNGIDTILTVNTKDFIQIEEVSTLNPFV